MACCNKPASRGCIFGCSTFVLLLALVLGLIWPPIALKFIYDELVLSEGSLNYNNWKETPIPMYLEFYMFNWTNHEDIENHSIKPNFEELGPYVFSEKHFRENITWNDNDTVTFYQKRVWHYVPEMSNGTLDDIIVNLNPILATVTHITRNNNIILKGILNQVFRWSGSKIHVAKTVRELLFDGYDDKVLDLIEKLPQRPDFPPIPFKKFGWFVDRNESLTYDGNFTMYTGKDDIFKLGILDLWNGSPNVSYYKDECGKVRGTTGELWPPIPPVNNRPDATIFATDFCRSVSLKYKEDAEKHGIKGYKWVGDESVFDNGKNFPEASCWCTQKEEECPSLMPGVFDASDCKFGAPAFVSYPHFYLADPSYAEAVSGLNPNQEEHEFFVAMEPTTGIPLSVNAKLQISLMLEPISGFTIISGVPKVFMPMFWFRQIAELTPELASQAWIAVNLPNIGLWIAYALAAASLSVIVVALSVIIYKRSQRDELNQHLIVS